MAQNRNKPFQERFLQFVGCWSLKQFAHSTTTRSKPTFLQFHYLISFNTAYVDNNTCCCTQLNMSINTIRHGWAESQLIWQRLDTSAVCRDSLSKECQECHTQRDEIYRASKLVFRCQRSDRSVQRTHDDDQGVAAVSVFKGSLRNRTLAFRLFLCRMHEEDSEERGEEG